MAKTERGRLFGNSPVFPDARQLAARPRVRQVRDPAERLLLHLPAMAASDARLQLLPSVLESYTPT